MIPPMPTIGIFTVLRTCQVIQTASGRIAGPESPPLTLARTGRRRSTSTTMPTNVLTSVTASAPSASAARGLANVGDVGRGFTHIGSLLRAGTRA